MYTIHPFKGIVTRDSDGAQVAPAQSIDDPLFVEYHAWIDAGNEPIEDLTPPAPEIVVPSSVSPRQIRLALNKLGLRDTVEAEIAVSSRDIRDTWEFSTEISITDPLVQSIATKFGADLNGLFILAASL
jgi:hypothetical protein